MCLNCSAGNFHALILFKDDEELKRVGEAVHRLIDRAIAMDGTCLCNFRQTGSMSLIIHDTGTGEHGVGVGKKDFLVAELGEGTVEMMRTIKKAVDPLNLFNPGKVRAFHYYL